MNTNTHTHAHTHTNTNNTNIKTAKNPTSKNIPKTNPATNETTKTDTDADAPNGAKEKSSKKKKERLCTQCGNPGAHLCSGCALVAYCSVACQKAAWGEHKLVCKKK